MTRVTQIAEQFTLDGTIDYVVYFSNGKVYTFRYYPTESDLIDPARRGQKVDT